jgi:AbrB family looped-hinge helix DNA binding protein
MSEQNYVYENAKVMAKGQITLPKDIRAALGIDTGSRVALVFDGEKVLMMNAVVYAMKLLREGMKGEAEKAGLRTEEDVVDMMHKIREQRRAE